MGRHRADSEDRQRHDDGQRLPAPQPDASDAVQDDAGVAAKDIAGIIPEDVPGHVPNDVPADKAESSTEDGAQVQAPPASLPAAEEPGLHPRRNSGRRARTAAAKPPAPKSSPRNHDLLGWGLFLAVTAAAAMMWAGIDWPVTAACGFLLLLSFAAVWYVSSTPSASAKTPGAAVPQKPSPAATRAASRQQHPRPR